MLPIYLYYYICCLRLLIGHHYLVKSVNCLRYHTLLVINDLSKCELKHIDLFFRIASECSKQSFPSLLDQPLADPILPG